MFSLSVSEWFEAAKVEIHEYINKGGEVTKQVEDRIHRIGSKNSVFIYRLICINTIDEVVEKAIELKGALADFVIDDKTDEKTVELLTDYILS